MMIDSLIEKIERKHNPEFDAPAQPEVTWVDMDLLAIIRRQQEQIEKLEKRLSELDSSLRAMSWNTNP